MRKSSLLVLASVLLIPALGAFGDWLVTTEGTAVETDGPWEVQGRLVVFTLADGTLSSMRASEVDLEASAAYTTQVEVEAAAAQEAAAMAEKEQPPKQVILTLTDADVGHVNPATGGGSAAPDSPSGAPESRDDLRIVSWREVDPGDGAEGTMLTGVVRNGGDGVLTEIEITASIYDEAGALITSSPAQLTAASLGPSEIANFRADFPDASGFSSASFAMSGRGFEAAPADGTLGPPLGGPEDEISGNDANGREIDTGGSFDGR